MKNQQARRSESGNVIFYIMAGIVLLAALTMAMAHGGRSSATNLTEDRVRLFATEAIAYNDAVAKAVSTLRLRGIQPGTMEFDTGALTGYANPACIDGSCQIYNEAGGGVTFTPVPKDWLDATFDGDPDYEAPVFSGTTCVPGVGIGDTTCATDGTDNEELIMFVPFVKKQVCMQINTLLGVPNNADDAPEMADCAWDAKFTGTFANDAMIEGTAPDAFYGKSAGCVRVPNGCAAAPDSYHFYQVLIAR